MFTNKFKPSFGALPQTTQSNLFGQTTQQPSSFLSGGVFGQSSSTFGSVFGGSNTSNTTTTMFGGTSQNQAGTSIPFKPVTSTDTVIRDGTSTNVSTRFQCISCMKEYEDKSPDELRLEDYQLNRKGPTQNKLFGGPQIQQSTSIFSSTNTNQNALGQGNSAFGTPSTGLFSSFNQTKPTSNLFSNPNSAVPFGGGSSTFSFNNQANQGTNLFSSNNQTTLSNSFTSQQPQQPAWGASAFGQKPVAPTSTSNIFGGFGTNVGTGGLFGTNSTAAPFGTGTTNIFGAQQPQQQKGFSFGASSQPQPFSSFSSSLQPLSNLTSQSQPFSSFTPQQSQPFSNFTAQQPQPFSGFTTSQSQPFSSFAQQPQPFSNFTSQPAFPSNFGGAGNPTFTFNNASTIGANTGFGTTAPNFSATGSLPSGSGSFWNASNLNTGNTGYGTPFSFNSSSGMGFPSMNQSTYFPPPNPLNVPPVYIPFATSPYKDSPLFYNIIANRSSQLAQPKNTLTTGAQQEAVKRNQSVKLNKTDDFSVAKKFNYSRVKPRDLKTDMKIFDGFVEDFGTSIDIFSPKSTVKTLSLKAVRTYEKPKYSFPTFKRESLSSENSEIFDSTHIHSNGSLNASGFEHSTRSNNLDYSTYQSGARINDTLQPYRNYLNLKESPNEANDKSLIENVPVIEESNGQLKCNVVCTRPDYYVYPSIEDLDLQTDETGACFVNGFTVGRENFGEINFLGVINVSGINIDELVVFQHKEVCVYPDDNNKPPVGEGLNCPAEIALVRVWPIDKSTRDLIKFPSDIRALNYEDKLRRACERQDAEFISYTVETGCWIFRVKHFSKYNCKAEDENEDYGYILPANCENASPSYDENSISLPIHKSDDKIAITQYSEDI